MGMSHYDIGCMCPYCSYIQPDSTIINLDNIQHEIVACPVCDIKSYDTQWTICKYPVVEVDYNKLITIPKVKVIKVTAKAKVMGVLAKKPKEDTI